jgi:hypothetical protein
MMTSISRALLLSAALMAAPVFAAVAQQQGNPMGNYGSNRSATASPGTADDQAASGTHTGDAGTRNTTGNSMGMTNAPGAPSTHQDSRQSYATPSTSLPGPATSQTGGVGMVGGAGSSK